MGRANSLETLALTFGDDDCDLGEGRGGEGRGGAGGGNKGAEEKTKNAWQ